MHRDMSSLQDAIGLRTFSLSGQCIHYWPHHLMIQYMYREPGAGGAQPTKILYNLLPKLDPRTRV